MKELRLLIATTPSFQSSHPLARPRQVRAHETWCSRCPSPDEVAELLEPLGFHLTFHLPASHYESLPQASLPAQYHFEDGCGTQVLYLAGRDASDDGTPLPPHASRFWAYAGADLAAYQQAMQTLAAACALTWWPEGTSDEPVRRSA